jgi:hypothetical protein
VTNDKPAVHDGPRLYRLPRMRGPIREVAKRLSPRVTISRTRRAPDDGERRVREASRGGHLATPASFVDPVTVAGGCIGAAGGWPQGLAGG